MRQIWITVLQPPNFSPVITQTNNSYYNKKSLHKIQNSSYDTGIFAFFHPPIVGTVLERSIILVSKKVMFYNKLYYIDTTLWHYTLMGIVKAENFLQRYQLKFKCDHFITHSHIIYKFWRVVIKPSNIQRDIAIIVKPTGVNRCEIIKSL